MEQPVHKEEEASNILRWSQVEVEQILHSRENNELNQGDLLQERGGNDEEDGTKDGIKGN